MRRNQSVVKPIHIVLASVFLVFGLMFGYNFSVIMSHHHKVHHSNVAVTGNHVPHQIASNLPKLDVPAERVPVPVTAEPVTEPVEEVGRSVPSIQTSYDHIQISRVPVSHDRIPVDEHKLHLPPISTHTKHKGAGLTEDQTTEKLKAAGLDTEARPLVQALAQWGIQPDGSAIAITFGDSNVLPHMLNFEAHLSKTGMPLIIAALDQIMLDKLTELDIPCYPFFVKFEGANSHSSASWKNFAVKRIGQVRALQRLGYDVLMTDIDVAWVRDPRPYLECPEGAILPPGVRCDVIRDADVMISSDNLCPKCDWDGGVNYPIYGTLNTGIVFVKRNAKGSRWVDEWLNNLKNAPGRYRTLTSDQQVFNMMMREPDKWPGIAVWQDSPVGTKVSRVAVAHDPPGESIKVGVLPLLLFMNGHGYFVQKAHEKYGIQPYAVHATYTFDGAGSHPKRHRFRAAGLWMTEEAGYWTGEATGGRFLTYKSSPVPVTGVPGVTPDYSHEVLEKHMQTLQKHVSDLKGALALAIALNRTLLLPELQCHCDKTWGGHDNIFKTHCMYPGAEARPYTPIVCPFDHILSPSTWDESGVSFRAAGFLKDPRVPGFVRNGGAVQVLSMTRQAYEEKKPHILAIPQGMKDTEAKEIFRKMGQLPVVEVDNPMNTVCSFEDVEDERKFNELARKLINPVSWCSECHPEGCAAFVSKETLGKGRIVPTRGGQHEMYCRDFVNPTIQCSN